MFENLSIENTLDVVATAHRAAKAKENW